MPFRIAPRIHICHGFKEFVENFQIKEDDLIITNEFIDLGIKVTDLSCRVIFQEQYGLGEPSDEMVDKVFAEARKKPYQRVIGIGGGTIIDISKLLALSGNGRTIEYFNGIVPVKKSKELIIIPTTCGTGSEVTNISIMEIKEENTKKGLADDALYADYAVLIPELLVSLPYRVFATSSVDALIHAVESFVSPGSNRSTELFSVKAMEMIIEGYQKIIAANKNFDLLWMEDFLLASTFAGIAFSNTGVGAVHALSYPLGGVYHVPHGEANQQMFIKIFQVYKELKPNGKIKDLEKILAAILKVKDEHVWKALDDLLQEILQKKPLHEYGMKKEETEIFAENVIQNQQRLLKNNYVPISKQQMVEIYEALY